jgi:hypothetical protein
MMAHNTERGMTAEGTREEDTEAMGEEEATVATVEVRDRDQEVVPERGTGMADPGREMEGLEPVHLEEAMGQELVLLSGLSQVIQASLIPLTRSASL